MSGQAGRPGEKTVTDAIAFARRHRPNYVIEAPGTEHEWTRLKCDGDDCVFYVEERGWRNWYEALDAHAAHLGGLIAAREAAAWAAALNDAADDIEMALDHNPQSVPQTAVIRYLRRRADRITRPEMPSSGGTS